MPSSSVVFFCFSDTSWERALISGVWFGGFQCRTNQAGLGLGVDGHGALESGQCIAGRRALAVHHMVTSVSCLPFKVRACDGELSLELKYFFKDFFFFLRTVLVSQQN